MMTRFFYAFFAVFFLNLLPTLRDTESIRVLVRHAAPDVCIICDLDNTLVRPACMLGSDEWFADFVSQGYKHSFSEYIQRLICLFEEIHHRVPLIKLENDSPEILMSCADYGARIIGMTARSRRLQERTVEQLRMISLDFSASSELQDQDLGDNKSICSGIVFCNGGNKAEIFRKLADSEGYRPSILIVIDDRREYLEQFKALCNEWGIASLLYHYRGADAYRECYSRAGVLEELGKFVEDYPEVADSALIICAASGMVEFLHP